MFGHRERHPTSIWNGRCHCALCFSRSSGRSAGSSSSISVERGCLIARSEWRLLRNGPTISGP
ncbi:hypothetical protein EN875_034990 [Mesorhizobium sp. M2D.F.Ca.ET.232.01.1.1]|nr:hypothetical protein EN875_034990 [Mesorhizobium sp. M2D.F.Ca.ET.232.01.1.1]